MMRTNYQSAETDLISVAALMAESLADVADRLSEDEFYRLISIGSTIYSHGLAQFSDDADSRSTWSSREEPVTVAGRRTTFRGRQ